MSNVERDLKIEQYEEAKKLKRKQDSIRSKYEFLKFVSTKYFQAEYVKAQASEICSYLTNTSLTPFNAWYSDLYSIIGEGEFMSKYYLTFNEHGVIVPDQERIDTLILPEPSPEDFPRGTVILA